MPDISYEETEKILADRIHEFPVVEKFIVDKKLDENIKTILAVEHIDEEFVPHVMFEVRLILGFYSPLRFLAKKLQSVSTITQDSAERIAVMFESLIPDDIMIELLTFEYYWFKELGDTGNIPEADKNMKEKLELRPQMGSGQVSGGEEKKEGGVRPLTREEVLKSIAPSRTMAKDIASVTGKGAPQTPTPPPTSPSAPTPVVTPPIGGSVK